MPKSTSLADLSSTHCWPIVQHKIDIGITTIAVSNTLRNKVGGNRLTGGDLDGAAQLLAYPPGVTQGNRQLIKQTFQPARQLLTRLGEHHFASSTVEQTDAGLMLQLLDAMADGRLTKPIISPARLKLLARATVTNTFN